jgi:acetolactate synthase I/II/III large subunit
MEDFPRRTFLAAAGAAAAASQAPAGVDRQGEVRGLLTGAQALVDALLAERCRVVFGIPGAQENELWDAFKQRGLPYLLSTHELAAACMADGAARPGGVPIVCIAGDIASGPQARPFQVHALPNAEILKPVCKHVFSVGCAEELPSVVRQAFQCARAGEPGPVGVVVPFNFLTERRAYRVPPAPAPALAWDDAAAATALAFLGDRSRRIGIHAGFGCMDHSAALVALAEALQAPVSTSVSGKGAMPEGHPLSVGWGYGPQGNEVAERVFRHEVDLLLAIGVKYGEVSTGFHSQPAKPAIQVDACAGNLGRILEGACRVHADAGLFLGAALARRGDLQRPDRPELRAKIARLKCTVRAAHEAFPVGPCVDPLRFFLRLREALPDCAALFVDVTAAEHWAAEAFEARGPRTYFNPTNNQSMGWALPAALGAAAACPGRPTVAVMGDGCFFMSAWEFATAARTGLPVKAFVLDDGAYHFMQALQMPAFKRTTATVLPRLDFRALAQGLGVAYRELAGDAELPGGLAEAIACPGPLLVRVATRYGTRPMRWLEAVRSRFVKELSAPQKLRFASRLGVRALANNVAKSD